MATLQNITQFANNPEAVLMPALQRAVLLVEASARQKAPRDTGELAGSITSRVESDGEQLVGIVGTNKVYAPYVEYGTGAFSSLGNGRQGYWVYVKGGDGTASKHSNKTYTLEEAKRIMAFLRSKGLEAFYTCGQKPQPYLQPALNENRDNILEIFKEAISNAGLS